MPFSMPILGSSALRRGTPLLYNLDLPRLEGLLPLPPSDVEAKVWPISLAEEQALPLELPVTWTLPIHGSPGWLPSVEHVPVKGPRR